MTSIFLCWLLKMDVIGTKIFVTFGLKIRVYMFNRTKSLYFLTLKHSKQKPSLMKLKHSCLTSITS